MFRLIKPLSNIARSNRVYIIPTLNGLKLFAINLLLLIFGLIYANNYLLFFNFLLFSLFVVTMFYTNMNLDKFTLEKIGLAIVEEGNLISLSTTKALEELSREQIKLSLFTDNGIIDSEATNIDRGISSFNFKFPSQKKGVIHFKQAYLSTTFPLGLFRAFMYVNIHSQIYIYPKQIVSSFDFNNQNNLNTDHSNLNVSNYVQGDKINRILWKKSIGENLIVRRESFDTTPSILIDLNQIPENELGKISYLANNDRCNLELLKNGQHIRDRKNILMELAAHES
jgi:uncharacterized protein (DUF58 family)